MQLERLLPVVQPVAVAVTKKRQEMPLHGCRKISQPRHFRQWSALVRRHGCPKNAGGAGVGRADDPALPQHDHPGGEVVQNGLQVRTGSIDLDHALLHRRPRIGQLLRHHGK